MEVRYRLSGVFALVDNQAVSVAQGELFGNFPGGPKNVEVVSLVGDFGKAGNLLSRHNQDVNGCLRIEIAKGNYVRVLIHNVSRYLAADDS